jgi:hypothetical protein
MIMHHLPMPRRLIGVLFPVLVLGIASVTAPTFIANGLGWWPVYIFALPLLLAFVICVEYWNIAVGFDASGVHYRSVGYEIEARWEQVSVIQDKSWTSLHLAEAQPRFYPWLGVMYQALTVLVRYRARHARGMMAIVPLSYFATRPDDPVMREFRHYDSQEARS